MRLFGISIGTHRSDCDTECGVDAKIAVAAGRTDSAKTFLSAAHIDPHERESAAASLPPDLTRSNIRLVASAASSGSCGPGITATEDSGVASYRPLAATDAAYSPTSTMSGKIPSVPTGTPLCDAAVPMFVAPASPPASRYELVATSIPTAAITTTLYDGILRRAYAVHSALPATHTQPPERRVEYPTSPNTCDLSHQTTSTTSQLNGHNPNTPHFTASVGDSLAPVSSESPASVLRLSPRAQLSQVLSAPLSPKTTMTVIPRSAGMAAQMHRLPAHRQHHSFHGLGRANHTRSAGDFTIETQSQYSHEDQNPRLQQSITSQSDAAPSSNDDSNNDLFHANAANSRVASAPPTSTSTPHPQPNRGVLKCTDAHSEQNSQHRNTQTKHTYSDSIKGTTKESSHIPTFVRSAHVKFQQSPPMMPSTVTVGTSDDISNIKSRNHHHQHARTTPYKPHQVPKQVFPHATNKLLKQRRHASKYADNGDSDQDSIHSSNSEDSHGNHGTDSSNINNTIEPKTLRRSKFRRIRIPNNNDNDSKNQDEHDGNGFAGRNFLSRASFHRESIWSINKRWNEMMTTNGGFHRANKGSNGTLSWSASPSTNSSHASLDKPRAILSSSSLPSSATASSVSNTRSRSIGHGVESQHNTARGSKTLNSESVSPEQHHRQVKPRDKKSISFNETVLCRSISRVEDLEAAFDREMIQLNKPKSSLQARQHSGSISDSDSDGSNIKNKRVVGVRFAQTDTVSPKRFLHSKMDWSDEDSDEESNTDAGKHSQGNQRQVSFQRRNWSGPVKGSVICRAQTPITRLMDGDDDDDAALMEHVDAYKDSSLNEGYIYRQDSSESMKRRIKSPCHSNDTKDANGRKSDFSSDEDQNENDDDMESDDGSEGGDMGEEGKEMDLDAMLDSTIALNDSHMALRPASTAAHDDADELLSAFVTSRDLGMDPPDQSDAIRDRDMSALLDHAINEIGDVSLFGTNASIKQSNPLNQKKGIDASRSEPKPQEEHVAARPQESGAALSMNTDTKLHDSAPNSTNGEVKLPDSSLNMSRKPLEIGSILDHNFVDEYVLSLLRVSRIESGELIPDCSSITSLAAACPTPPDRSLMSIQLPQVCDTPVSTDYLKAEESVLAADGADMEIRDHTRMLPLSAWNSNTTPVSSHALATTAAKRMTASTARVEPAVEEAAAELLATQDWPSMAVRPTNQVDPIKELEDLLDEAATRRLNLAIDGAQIENNSSDRVSSQEDIAKTSIGRSRQAIFSGSIMQKASSIDAHRGGSRLAQMHSESTLASSDCSLLGDITNPTMAMTAVSVVSRPLRFIESMVRPSSRGDQQFQQQHDGDARADTRLKHRLQSDRGSSLRKTRLMRPKTPAPGLWQIDTEMGAPSALNGMPGTESHAQQHGENITTDEKTTTETQTRTHAWISSPTFNESIPWSMTNMVSGRGSGASRCGSRGSSEVVAHSNASTCNDSGTSIVDDETATSTICDPSHGDSMSKEAISGNCTKPPKRRNSYKDLLRRGPRDVASTTHHDASTRQWFIWKVLSYIFSRHNSTVLHDRSRKGSGRVVPSSN